MTSPKPMPTLKSCPFCGKKPISAIGPNGEEVECSNKACGFSGIVVPIDGWNSRSVSPAFSRLVDTLESDQYFTACWESEDDGSGYARDCGQCGTCKLKKLISLAKKEIGGGE